MNTYLRICSFFVALLVMMSILAPPVMFGQEAKPFATQGCMEIGGSISFLSTTPVFYGNTNGSMSTFSFQPFIGYFVSDGFELGFDPLGLTYIDLGGTTITQVTIFAAPSYNFRTGGNAYPFIEALLGYTSQSVSSTSSGFSWGGRGGVKIAVTDKGLLNLGVQYLQITLDRPGAGERNGSNQFSIAAGFTVWF